ncbi:hypothetical protein SASPL_116248 [Salvia splendens]|uniref:SHSP domain-containing protein n=1 Tax=Salvia splendens TaxID=180675 RepID=A0A8X8XSV9_SALSN|nr:uncharacterized protein LOC121808055 [Salvia splendens]KAG6419736.1 hypothetical protein SASPL_116248 [Salvia splendens]
MELELGLKLTNAADEFASDFLIAKDRAGPVFVSRETDTAFFLLTAHLKGYKRRNIKIDINEDGSLIGIGGEKHVQETVMVGWKLYKKETETKGFKKVFRIPQGVILDKIKATFNEDESTLSITMPKKAKGIRGGTAIEEVKDRPELVRAGSGSLQIADEKSAIAESSNKGKIGEDGEEQRQEKPVSDHDLEDVGRLVAPSIHGARVEGDTCKEDEEKQSNIDDVQEIKDEPDTYKQDVDERSYEGRAEPSAIEPSQETPEAKPRAGEDDEESPREKRLKLCLPIVAGSTLFLTFVAFVFQMIRSKHQTSRKRD